MFDVKEILDFFKFDDTNIDGWVFKLFYKGTIHILQNGLEGGRGSLKYYIPLRGGGGRSNQKLHNNYRLLKNDKNHEISQNLPN